MREGREKRFWLQSWLYQSGAVFRDLVNSSIPLTVNPEGIIQEPHASVHITRHGSPLTAITFSSIIHLSFIYLFCPFSLGVVFRQKKLEASGKVHDNKFQRVLVMRPPHHMHECLDMKH